MVNTFKPGAAKEFADGASNFALAYDPEYYFGDEFGALLLAGTWAVIRADNDDLVADDADPGGWVLTPDLTGTPQKVTVTGPSDAPVVPEGFYFVAFDATPVDQGGGDFSLGAAFNTDVFLIAHLIGDMQKIFYYWGGTDSIRSINPLTGDVINDTYTGGVDFLFGTVSPDLKKLLFVTSTSLAMYDTDYEYVVWEGASSYALGGFLSNDEIIYYDGDYLRKASTADGSVIASLNTSDLFTEGYLSPDRSEIALATHDDVTIFDTATMTQSRTASLGRMDSLVWAGDYLFWVILTGGDNNLYYVDASTLSDPDSIATAGSGGLTVRNNTEIWIQRGSGSIGINQVYDAGTLSVIRTINLSDGPERNLFDGKNTAWSLIIDFDYNLQWYNATADGTAALNIVSVPGAPYADQIVYRDGPPGPVGGHPCTDGLCGASSLTLPGYLSCVGGATSHCNTCP